MYSWRLLALVTALVSVPAVAVATSTSLEVMKPFGEPVPELVLSEYRGASGIIFNTNNLDAHLHDNEAYNNVTGNNQLTDQAFSGASGLPTVIQNSGNNVIIQNASIINVTIQ
ncbi:hypothetical protein H0A71_23125 [Alcaligenaceae bacterium]|nr:hypothetical protein [Alcaligenaceae bacterium]